MIGLKEVVMHRRWAHRREHFGGAAVVVLVTLPALHSTHPMNMLSLMSCTSPCCVMQLTAGSMSCMCTSPADNTMHSLVHDDVMATRSCKLP